MNSSYVLIGYPLGHSLSPYIHRRLLQLSDQSGTYTLRPISTDTLKTAFPALLTEVRGGNVTIPHKQAVLPFMDRLEGKGKLYQTVNCFAVTPDGVIGYNTDADGFLQALRQEGLTLQGRVLLVGTGGAGTVFAYEALQHGCELVLYNPRTPANAVALRDTLTQAFPAHTVTAADTEPDGTFDWIINATPVGMYPHTDACPISDALLSRCNAAFDAIYNPRETAFLKSAKANGAAAVGGMAMLVWQAALSHTLWYGATFSDADIRDIIDGCYDELAAQFNG